MAQWWGRTVQAVRAWRAARRRARNLRQRRMRVPDLRIVAFACALVAGGAVIAVHARKLASTGNASVTPGSADALQAALPGAAFTVPDRAGIAFTRVQGGTLVIASGMQAAPPLRVNLCARPLPLRLGYQFDELGHLAGMRNVALARPDAPMPHVMVGADGASLRLRWDDAQLQWAGDGTAPGHMQRDGWLAWSPGAALRIQKRSSAVCPVGELVLQVFRVQPGAVAQALVLAYPASGQPRSVWLAPGRYTVPQTVSPGLEDQALFEQLRARALVHLSQAGAAELVPADLAAWRSTPASLHAADLAQWDSVVLDPVTQKLIKRLYRAADGDYVRTQLDVFNGEQHLLAWRQRQDTGVRADVPQTDLRAMPASAARLFDTLPQGWAPWTRLAVPGERAHVELVLPHPALAGQKLQLLLAGRILGMRGATWHAAPACTGHGCPASDTVQMLTLELASGSTRVAIDAAPLDLAALARPGDQRYRHVYVADGQLAWQPLPPAAAPVHTTAANAVTLLDRQGTLVWSGGAATPAAADAGLATLLGVHAGHAGSVAGMLARLPSATGLHTARLSIDLALQSASQHALDCIGMRRGSWDGSTCTGGHAAPAERQAGVVVIDTENGDILAAAGAGTAPVNAANWNEVRDFDRANPARSPLRLPALQHDGGAHRSPGSTFKVVSALGLEQAARTNPQLDALLAGMPLVAINGMARQLGFAFQTDAAVYPVGTRLAHITNFRDQHLDRRAQDGKLGLAQALTYSLNTWFAWSGELSDASLFGQAQGGAPDVMALEPGALDAVRPIAAMAAKLGFGTAMRLDGGLLGAQYPWAQWDALQASAARIDPIQSRHELRQMSIGLRMQATPLQMALVAGAVGQGSTVVPRLLLALDGHPAVEGKGEALGVRLDRVRSGMRGVVDHGTAAGAFRGAVRAGLSGKTGTAPTGDGALATVWFTGWLEPGSVPGQTHRLAIAAFVSHSEATGGEHAAPIAAAVLAALARNGEQRGK